MQDLIFIDCGFKNHSAQTNTHALTRLYYSHYFFFNLFSQNISKLVQKFFACIPQTLDMDLSP